MNQEDLLPVNRNYYLIGGCVAIIFTVVVGGILYSTISNKNQASNTTNSIAVAPEGTAPQSDLSKYNQDSDQDKIPNFIEQDGLLNQYIAETTYCENKFPSCANSPIEKPTYVTVLLNASTSMNIPATSQMLKYQLVKNEMIKNLTFNKKNSYLKIGIASFGNKGNLNALADNESCVSNISLKKFDAVISDNEGQNQIQNFFKQYVPNGKSPLAYTLSLVEKGFPDPKGNNVVEVITDGNDDCNGDLKSAIKDIKARGIVKRIDLISIYANQDENNILKEAIETNGGKFSTSTNIDQTLGENYNSFIYESWCKVKNFANIYQCVNQDYNKASELLNSKLGVNTPRNEVDKVKEILSSMNVVVENYRKNNDDQLHLELDNFLKPKTN